MSSPQRPRRRADELLDALRAAVRDELEDHGYMGVTFEGVARRAGTSKPVLYRRYASRAQMVLDAVKPSDLAELEPPNMGSLREDLLVLLAEFAQRVRERGIDVLRGIIAEVDEPTIGYILELTSRYIENRLTVVIAHACERGELGPRPVPVVVATSTIALVRHELIFTNGELDRAGLEVMVDQVFLPLLRETTRA